MAPLNTNREKHPVSDVDDSRHQADPDRRPADPVPLQIRHPLASGGSKQPTQPTLIAPRFSGLYY